MSSSSSRRVNPFYIEPAEVAAYNYNDDDDEFYNNDNDDWHDDTDDLDELLEYESPLGYQQQQQQHSFPRRQRHRRRRLLPVEDPILQRRLRLSLSIVLVVVVLVTWLSSSSSGRSSSQSFNGRYDDDTNDTTTTAAVTNVTASRELHISVLGERNSGRSWLTKKLQSCYPHISVASSLQREGMWFQDDSTIIRKLPPTIVVVVVRNPYDWVEQMRRHPQYAPSHVGLSWEAFVTTPWTTTVMDDDNDEAPGSPSETTCQLGFAPHRVVPCVPSNESSLLSPSAVYELNPVTGRPFGSIVDLRAAKIRQFVKKVADWDAVEGRVVTVPYERLVGDALDGRERHSALPGLLTTLNQIKSRVGLDYECDVISDKSLFAPAVGSHKEMKQAYVDWMNEHVDWEAEALVGYTLWEEIPPSQVNWDESNPDGLAQDEEHIDHGDPDDMNDKGNSGDSSDIDNKSGNGSDSSDEDTTSSSNQDTSNHTDEETSGSVHDDGSDNQETTGDVSGTNSTTAIDTDSSSGGELTNVTDPELVTNATGADEGSTANSTTTDATDEPKSSGETVQPENDSASKPTDPTGKGQGDALPYSNAINNTISNATSTSSVADNDEKSDASEAANTTDDHKYSGPAGNATVEPSATNETGDDGLRR